METPFSAYSGEDDFVFSCYSHQDAEIVYQELQRLHDAGVNIWYDEGITPGSEWTDELANAIRNCKSLVLFATPRSVSSKHCRDEVQYAVKFDKPVIVIYLEPTELPPGLDLMLGALHAVEKGHHDEERYLELIMEAIRQPKHRANQVRAEVQTNVAADNVAADNVVAKAGPSKSAASNNPLRKPSPFGKYALVAALVLAVLGFAWWQLQPPEQPKDGAPTSQPSIALLPFEDRGGFGANDYYPESVSEDLLNRLVAIEGLSVASRRSSFHFDLGDPNSLTLPDIAEQLSVDHLVVGYIRRTNDSIRLSVELIELVADTEVVRWSDSFDNLSLSEMLSVQNQITRQIGTTLLPDGLSRISLDRLARVSTDSPEAYEYYLQASDILRNPAEPAMMVEAARLMSTAIELDENYAWAKAGLCKAARLQYQERVGDFPAVKQACELLTTAGDDIFEVRLALGSYYRETGQFDAAEEELTAAVGLNKFSADARLELARLLAARYAIDRNTLDRVAAEQAYLEAIETEPDYWYGYHSFSIFLTDEGRLNEAQEHLHRALALEPTSVGSLNNLAAVQYRLGDTDKAELNWLKSLTLSSANGWAYSGLGILYHYEGDYPKAVEYFQKGTEESPQDHDLYGRLGESLRLIPGREEEAVQAFLRAAELTEERLTVNPTDWHMHGFLALCYTYANQHSKAKTHLARMFELNSANNPMKHYWSALIAYEEKDVAETFKQLDLALKYGFSQQKRFIVEEPALQALYAAEPARFEKLMAKY